MLPPTGGESVQNKQKTKAKKDEVISSDIQGSYTGRPADPYEEPVQDVDDL